MLQAESLEFDASPVDGSLIGIEQVHAAHEGINVFVLNFPSYQGQHVHSPRVTAAQQHDGPFLRLHDLPLALPPYPVWPPHSAFAAAPS